MSAPTPSPAPSMESTIKVLRTSTRNLIIFCVTMLFFLFAPDRKFEYTQAIEELKEFRALDVKSIAQKVADSLINQDRPYNEFRDALSAVIPVDSVELVVPASDNFSVEIGDVYSYQVLLSAGRWNWKYYLPAAPGWQRLKDSLLNLRLAHHVIYQLEFNLDYEDNNYHIYKGDLVHHQQYIKGMFGYAPGDKKFRMSCIVRSLDGLGAKRIYTFSLPAYTFFPIQQNDISTVIPRPFRHFIQEWAKNVLPKTIRALPTSEKYKLSPEEALHYCEVRYADAQSKFDFLGMAFDKTIIAVLGPFIILIITLYVVLHTMELGKQVSVNKLTYLYEPWFPLYTFGLARFATWALLFVLPVGTCFALFTVWDPEGWWLVVSWVLMISLLFTSYSLVGIIGDLNQIITQNSRLAKAAISSTETGA